MQQNTESRLRSLGDFENELLSMEKMLRDAAIAVKSERRDLALIVHQADWHVRGVLYHTRKVLSAYCEFAEGVTLRATDATEPDVIIMHAPVFQSMMFEFHALVNLSRITMDNLRIFLRPVFNTDFGQLPKSITKFISGKTDCPVYERLVNNATLQYLCDLRNCIVHFRTFATGDNAVVVGDHVNEQEKAQLLAANDWLDPMARAHYRRVGTDISVNVLLPDRIFDHSGRAEKLAPFTYTQRYNVLSQSMQFAKLVCETIFNVYDSLVEPGKPTFGFSKNAP